MTLEFSRINNSVTKYDPVCGGSGLLVILWLLLSHNVTHMNGNENFPIFQCNLIRLISHLVLGLHSPCACISMRPYCATGLIYRITTSNLVKYECFHVSVRMQHLEFDMKCVKRMQVCRRIAHS